MKNVKDPVNKEEFLSSINPLRSTNDIIALAFYGNDNIIDFKNYLDTVEYCSKALKFKDLYVCKIDDEECDFNVKEKYFIKRIPTLIIYGKGESIEIKGTFSNEMFYEIVKFFSEEVIGINFTTNSNFRENFINWQIQT